MFVAGLAVDGDEEGFAAGEQVVGLVGEGGGAEVFAALDAVPAALEDKGCVERGGAEVLGFHMAGEGHDFRAVPTGMDGFAYGFVKNGIDGGDDATMNEAVRASEVFGQVQGGVDGAGFVNHEAKPYADAVVRAAAEAVVPVVEGERGEVVKLVCRFSIAEVTLGRQQVARHMRPGMFRARVVGIVRVWLLP